MKEGFNRQDVKRYVRRSLTNLYSISRVNLKALKSNYAQPMAAVHTQHVADKYSSCKTFPERERDSQKNCVRVGSSYRGNRGIFGNRSEGLHLCFRGQSLLKYSIQAHPSLMNQHRSG